MENITISYSKNTVNILHNGITSNLDLITWNTIRTVSAKSSEEYHSKLRKSILNFVIPI